MNFKLEQNEQYAVIELNESALTVDNAGEFEDVVRGLFRKGYGNMIVEFNAIEELDGYGVAAIRKANKICLNEVGLFVVVTKNEEIIDRLDNAKIEDLTIMPTVQEAIDAIFLNELENDFQEEEDEFGFGGEGEGASEDDY